MKNKDLFQKILKQCKFKNFNTLKYTSNFSSHTISREDDGTHDRLRKLLYSDIINQKPSKSSKSSSAAGRNRRRLGNRSASLSCLST